MKRDRTSTARTAARPGIEPLADELLAAASGAGAGSGAKARLHELGFVKVLDKATPLLF